MVSGVGQGIIGVLDRGGDHRRGRGSFGGEFGASHFNQWGLLHRPSCARATRSSQMTLGRTCYANQIMQVLYCWTFSVALVVPPFPILRSEGGSALPEYMAPEPLPISVTHVGYILYLLHATAVGVTVVNAC